MRLIEQYGPFEIHGDPDIMLALDALLRAFVDQRRMKLVGRVPPLLPRGGLSGRRISSSSRSCSGLGDDAGGRREGQVPQMSFSWSAVFGVAVIV
jgi:hypothetical protein